MRFLKTISVILDILILVPGVCSGQWWRVNFTNPSPCVMRGSSVDIGCSYFYPVNHTVTKTYWFIWDQKTQISDSKPLSYNDRIKYIGNKQHDCTLRINNTEDSDEGDYRFRFITKNDKWMSQPVYLSVTELSVHVTSPTVSEGTWVTLTCQTSCKQSLNIVWFKNEQRVSNPEFHAKVEDAGSYQCAIEGQETWKSEAVMLDVKYGPKNVVLSISPPGDVVKGSSVTLTCSSTGSNPPIQSYVLLKDNTEVTQKKTMTISNIQPSDRGRYSCQAKNGITVTSPEVTLHVHSNNVALISGVVASLFMLIWVFVFVFWVRKKRTNSNQEPASVPVVSGRSSEPLVLQQEQDVDYCSVTFKPAGTRAHADHSLQNTPSGETGKEDEVIYSTVKEDVSAIYSTVDKTQKAK